LKNEIGLISVKADLLSIQLFINVQGFIFSVGGIKNNSTGKIKIPGRKFYLLERKVYFCPVHR
jgi:hypothetical protein